MEYHGKHENNLLYVDAERAVVVDTLSNTVTCVDEAEALIASAPWDASFEQPEGVSEELAKAAVTQLDIQVLASNERMYTIPKSVVAEAKRGLAWRKEEKRGGTPVGLNTARRLAKGGQIGIEKVRHIAKYFPRHEVDKKAKGYKPGDDKYPSNGRIAWALWGGDAAQRWASAIVERENKKKGVTAALYEEYYGEERIDYNSFAMTGIEPDYYIRINLQSGAIDRLYKVEDDGACKVWDDGYWDDMGNVEHDFETYDKALDDPYDKSQKTHLPIDRETAIAISAMMDNAPMSPTFLKQINFEETELFEAAMPELDFKMLDQFSDETVDELEMEEEWDDGLLASGTATFEVDTTPGEYTPEERSEKASKQVRDKMGRFAKTGSRVVIGGDPNYQGNITALNPENQSVVVKLDNGESVTIAGTLTQEVSTFQPVSTANFPSTNLDFTGILGEPRVPIDQPNAQLPGRLPAITASSVNTLVEDWSSWVSEQRLSPEYDGDPIPPIQYKAVPDINTALGRYYQGAFNPDGTAKPGWNPATTENVYNEPLLRDWLDATYGNKSGKGAGQTYAGWYRPKTYPGVKIDDKKSRSQVVSPGNRKAWADKYDPTKLSVMTAAANVEERELTPENTDVKPMYLAIVADDDPQSVMELVCLVPASTKSATPTAFVRKPGKWVSDNQVVNDLNSPTPPPVIVLDNENLAHVVEQIDGETITASAHFALTNNKVILTLMAAGGLDRNRGNAEKLRRYWKFGKGALKIRWNTPGDWTRCVRQLRKYMGPRAKGYCALRHKEMTGVWPGDRKNIGKKKKRGKALRASAELEQNLELKSLRSESEIIETFTLRARAMSAKSKVMGRNGVVPKEHGAKFVIPLVIPEGAETGDGRIFEKGSITIRDLPLPLLWQIKTGNGHDGSVVVGQITYMERTPEGIGNAIGVFDTGEYGQEAERLVQHGFIRGVSADMDKFEADEEIPEQTGDESKDSEKIGSGRINIKSARVMAVTIVPKPAFQECFIQIAEETSDAEEETVQPDGVYVDNVNPLDASALVACGMVAGAIPNEPPKEWFDNPKLKKATPLTITDDGRVFGHIAAWHVDHIGMAFGTKPPRSRSKYSYFHTGVLRTAEGEDVPVGQLTLAGGHAGLDADAAAAMKHYDDTASAFADVHAGEDAHGIWVSGSLRPGTTPEQIRAARASAPSGDWRPIKGSLELVAVCQVNVPGFPIARARVASGQVMALVAAGASVLAQLKSDPIAELNAKVDALTVAQLSPKREEALEKFAALKSETQEPYRQKMTELAARVKEPLKKDSEDDSDSWDYMIQMMDDDPENELAVVPRRVRERLAREGKALPDGSFPIRNISDLRNAVRAYGRSKPGSRGAVRKHIMRRARGLNRPDLIPAKWSTDYSDLGIDEMPNFMRALAEFATESTNLEALFENESLTAAAGDDKDLEGLSPEEIKAIKAESRNRKTDDDRPKFTPDTQPRDASGKFRKVLARLKADLGVAGLSRVIEKVEEAENLDNAGDYERSAEAADELIGIIDRLDAKALNPDSIENVRNSAAELGKVIANLPFSFGKQEDKIRFSDVPPALKNLIKDMIERVEEKIGQEDADIATADLKNFMSGGDYYSQADISSQMSKLLRLLT